MRQVKTVIALAFITLIGLWAGPGRAESTYWLWLGSHTTDLNDNAKKIGEFNLGNSETLPELQFHFNSVENDRILRFNGHYFDDQNISARFDLRKGQSFGLDVRYRSLIHQFGQDLLGNLAAREIVGYDSAGVGIPGGKMLTHEVTDPKADYNYNRHEILSRFSARLSEKNNVRFEANHRSIIKKGTEQSISSNHCYSCHVTSKSAEVKRQTHQAQAELKAEVGAYDVGYQIGYRTFKSTAPESLGDYDLARHPAFIDSIPLQQEFGSRLNFDDTTLPVNSYPETEKIAHKLKLRGELGAGRVATSVSYNVATNNKVDLQTKTWSGAVSYRSPISKKSFLLARATASRVRGDDIFIDLATFREGRPGVTADFDFTRYSALDRKQGEVSAELISRVSRKTTLSALGGYKRIERDDYPIPGTGSNTDHFYGQAKLRYRNGLKFNGRLKYRVEATKDPFLSSKGLFEAVGRDELSPLASGFKFIFYFQREDIRFQNITSEPTIEHSFDGSLNWKVAKNVNVNVGARGSYGANHDLDSLDVEQFKVQPILSLSVTPEPRVSFDASYSYTYAKSRGPVTVALFDG